MEIDLATLSKASALTVDPKLRASSHQKTSSQWLLLCSSSLVDTHKLHTICESGNCPNMGECWGAGTATFMILGNTCTRSCGFCAVATGRPDALDWDEPPRVAEAFTVMKVKHAMITSVDRDEIKDGG